MKTLEEIKHEITKNVQWYYKHYGNTADVRRNLWKEYFGFINALFFVEEINKDEFIQLMDYIHELIERN